MKKFFQKWFSGKRNAGDTAPLAQEKDASGAPADAQADKKPNQPTAPNTMPLVDKHAAEIMAGLIPHVDIPQMIVGCGQSSGQQRDHNEDAIFTLTTTLISDSTHIPFGLYMVADGMGGHQHGEIASGAAIRALVSYVMRKLYLPLFGPAQEQPEESLQEIMQMGVLEAHKAILRYAPGGGTTLTGVLVMGDMMTLTHVGDSRAYTIDREGYLQVLTRDHSLVKRLEELGQITPEEAASHPQRNVLYRALGQGEPFEPDNVTMPVPKGGCLLICSDGLWGVVPERDILLTVQNTANPQEACQILVDAANAAGGPDNISAVLVRMPV